MFYLGVLGVLCVEDHMKRLFLPLALITAAMFAYAPIAIANAPYESTMLLIQKIFYFHVPSWMAMTAAIAVCGVASLVHLFKIARRPTVWRYRRRS